jgi:hypothetical protein
VRGDSYRAYKVSIPNYVMLDFGHVEKTHSPGGRWVTGANGGFVWGSEEGV